jgi:pimeloyl-ACP methyl ester carboxylesterase
MGGIIAMMMAAAHPSLIRSLVLNDVGCLIPTAGLKRILSYAGVQMNFPTRAQAEAALRERCAPFGITSEAQWQHLFDHSIEQVDGVFRFACDPAIVQGFPKEKDIKDIDLWPLWKNLSDIPILLLRGANSDILTHATAMEMKMRHANLVLQEIPGAGHAPALMEISQITLIADWLRFYTQQKTHGRLWKLLMRLLSWSKRN